MTAITLTHAQADILDLCAKHGSYTAFTSTAVALCDDLVARGLLVHEGDSLYTLAASTGARPAVTMPPVTPMPAARLPLLMTDDILRMHENALALRGKSKVLYVAALEALFHAVSEARGMA